MNNQFDLQGEVIAPESIMAAIVSKVKAGESYIKWSPENPKHLSFSSNINYETSYNSTSQGDHNSTMELMNNFIEWVVETLDDGAGIGLEFTNGKLDGYDGVFDIPIEALVLCALNGVSIDFDELCTETPDLLDCLNNKKEVQA